jgi:hypothetical protein
MELTYSLWFMMICSFLIQLTVMSGIMTNSYKNIFKGAYERPEKYFYKNYL